MKDKKHKGGPKRDHAPRRPTAQKAGERGPFAPPSADIAVIYGTHSVRAALTARRRKLLALYATDAALPRIADAACAAGLKPRNVDARDLDRRLGEGAAHQGVLLEARPLPDLDIADIETKSGVALALDQITDPHNFGAILRTACAFGVDAVIVTDRHRPEFSGALAKAASGALEHTPIVAVVNLARALDQLRDAGHLLIGLDSDGAESLAETPLQKPLVLVLGAEGKGLRRLTRERCDVISRLDLPPGPIKSLNVSSACAAALSVLRMRLG
ncbi:MAG: RNA methyltransferase [Methylocystis sp.]|nr:RNA methyltransferase [Methylocystis sp.]